MAIPDFQSIMLPLLRVFSDGREHPSQECILFLAEHYNLTEEERKIQLPSGKGILFNNRVAWGLAHMYKAGLLKRPKRAIYQITDRGCEALASGLDKITLKYLDQFPEHIAFRKPAEPQGHEASIISELVTADTPEEALESAHQELKETLASDIIQTIKQCSPEFFERLVVDVLVKMGYGGSRKEAGQAVGKSGDGGIDGIIKEDRLGLDIIYIQAKRWENVVGRPEIQKFAGALLGNHARKGILITSSYFSKDAIEYVTHIEGKIILIDGARLADLMIEHNVGTTTVATYEVKRLDSDYFIGEI
ncbi:MAG TPA: restriction endonuclease [Candidatus Hydrogenedentes bacterium]|nr:restriction endonuclease [Candidatus Hydrogenedentota bacterium]